MRLRHLIVLACIGTTLVVAGPSQAVVGGAPDADHPYVAAIQIPLPGRPPDLCSGSMISATVMVTAGHCFPMSPWPVLVHFGPAVPTSPPTPIPGTAYVYGFEPTPRGVPGAMTNDVAVVVLEAPAPVSTFATLPAPGAADSLGKKASVTVVGYGVAGFVGPFPVGQRVRRAADVEVIDRNGVGDGTHLRLSPNDADPCRGDSGGPNLALGTSTILAVTSVTFSGRCQGSYAYRIDNAAALAFINSFLG